VQNPKTGNKLSEKSIDKVSLRLMQSFENLSAVRLKFIKTERTLLDLKAQNDELNFLGDGFRMEDFESLHHEADLISSKIDSKDDELTKLRKKCYENTQIMAHLEEKQWLVLADIQDLEEEFFTQKSEESRLKDKLNGLIKEKEKHRAKLTDLEASAGLMNHQILLKKYDEFDEKVCWRFF
jgi:chromosome segregation ATPase